MESRLLWIALPNGYVGGSLKVTAFLSPRLVGGDKLADFPWFASWPETLTSRTLSVRFNAGAPLPATRTSADPDSALWKALFPPQTPVRAPRNLDHAALPILSYPALQIARSLDAFYRDLGGKPDHLPTTQSMLNSTFIQAILPHSGLGVSAGDDGTGIFRRNIDEEERDLAEGGEHGAQLQSKDLSWAPGREHGPEVYDWLRSIDKRLEVRRELVASVANPRRAWLAKARAELEERKRFESRRVAAVAALEGELAAHRHLAPQAEPAPEHDFAAFGKFHRPGKTDRDRTLAAWPPEPAYDVHDLLSVAGSYPWLLRKLGLAIDLEVDAASTPDTGVGQVMLHVDGVALGGVEDIYPPTRYEREGSWFGAASRNPAAPVVVRGFAMMDSTGILQMDVDGSAEKALQLANNLYRGSRDGKDTVEEAPPSLRSAGLGLFRDGRAGRLVQALDTGSGFESALRSGEAITLYAEDLIRGWRPDVKDETQTPWRSLCLRDGTYRLRDGGKQPPVSDEGWVELAVTQNNHEDTRRLSEALFTWDGWSLAAPRPGKHIAEAKRKPDGTRAGPPEGPTDASRMPTRKVFALISRFEPTPNSLPRLRFGRKYRFRMRAVDLCGNGIGLEAGEPPKATTPATAYLRFEPLAPPAVALDRGVFPKHALGAIVDRPLLKMNKAPKLNEAIVGRPGESVHRMVVRSWRGQAIGGDSTRVLFVPRTSQAMQELCGVYDKTSFARPAQRGGDLTYLSQHGEAAGASSAVLPEHDAPLDRVPYLPDPLAGAISIRGLPGTPETVLLSFVDAPREHRPVVLALLRGTEDKWDWDAVARRLTVTLAPASLVRLSLSTAPADRAALERFAPWRMWIAPQETDAATVDRLAEQALKGEFWMLSPIRQMELVHAVGEPLLAPQLALAGDRAPQDANSAELGAIFPGVPAPSAALFLSGQISNIDPRSTERLEITASWTDIYDEGKDPPVWKVVPPSVVFAEQVANQSQIDLSDLRHFLPDTKRRDVTYVATGSSRFAEHFDPRFTLYPVSGAPVTVLAECAAKPQPPVIRGIVPVFTWQESEQAAGHLRRARRANVLRVLLERPWFSSGPEEMLGVMLGPKPQGPYMASLTPSQRDVVSWIGGDPIWRTRQVEDLRPEHFDGYRVRDATLTELGVESQTSPTGISLKHARATVLGFDPQFDKDRNCWFCDINLNLKDNLKDIYAPFVRLVLARFQMHAVRSEAFDASISAVVVLDPIPLPANRDLQAWWDGDCAKIDLTGPGYRGTDMSGDTFGGLPPLVKAAIEVTKTADPTDFDWFVDPSFPQVAIPVNIKVEDLGDLGQRLTLHAIGKIQGPPAGGSLKRRLVVREFEQFNTLESGGSPDRPVYVDVVELA